MDELIINIQAEEDSSERVAKAEKKVAAAIYQPTLQEVWFKGWTNNKGTLKKGIMQTKVTDSDKEKLKEVYEAIVAGELPVGIDDMRKFTKAHALRLHKVLKEKRKHSIIKDYVDNMPDNYHLVNDYESFRSFLKMIRKEEEFAIDTETTGLSYFHDEIVGLSFTLPTYDYHCYIPVRHSEGPQLPAEYVFKMLKPILENPEQKKIFFNAKFDVHMLIRDNIWVQNVFFDGYVAMKLLNENEDSYSLKNLSTKYGKHFGFEDRSVTYEELFGKGGFQDAQFITSDGRRGIAIYYTCKDTHLTYRFYKDFVMKHFARLPKLKDLYFNIERPITEICVEMEQNGFRIDMEFAAKYGQKLKHQIDRMERVLTAYFGGINIGSNQQLSQVLYDERGLDKHFPAKWKKSVDAKTLKKLAQYDKGIKMLLKYRELSKLYSTYILPMPEKTVDGYLHGEFLQVQTATGRFASKNPNLQNLPYAARKMVIATEGEVIIGADYSQIEPRVLAHFTQDESMIDAYVTGRDLYIEMAMKVFKLDRKYCEDKAYDPTGSFQPRKAIKSVLLGIMYGMGTKSLADGLKMTEQQAAAIIEDFYQAFPKVRAWMDDRIKFAEDNEYIETMFGRKRRFVGFKMVAKRYHKAAAEVKAILGHIPDFIWAEEYYEVLPYNLKREFWDMSKAYAAVTRRVINTIIQGSAADIMKLAMVEVAKICRKRGYKMLATIHDEVLISTPENISLEATNEIEAAMLGVVKLRLPMKVDSAFMRVWGEETGKDEWFEGKAA